MVDHHQTTIWDKICVYFPSIEYAHPSIDNLLLSTNFPKIRFFLSVNLLKHQTCKSNVLDINMVTPMYATHFSRFFMVLVFLLPCLVPVVPITNKNNSYSEEMIARGLKPNIFTYNSFVQASSDSWVCLRIFWFSFLFVWLVGGLVWFWYFFCFWCWYYIVFVWFWFCLVWFWFWFCLFGFVLIFCLVS